MKRLGAAASAAALLGALAISSPALAFGGFWGAGWNGGGWQVNGWHGDWCLRPGSAAGLGVGYGLTSGWDCDDYYRYPGHAYAPRVATTLSTGRSVAEGAGDFCTTEVRKCELPRPSSIGARCSCRIAGGRARGWVTP
jgi:hypothetical protein